MSSKKFKVVTLGCRTNQYESQAYHDQLIQLGYAPAEDEQEQAEICIVNTCTVTESADSGSRQQIRKLARAHPNAKIVVTGCSTTTQADIIAQIPGVTHVIQNQDKERLIELLFPQQEVPEFAIHHFEAHTRAFVKVQDGCNSFCTYCIIPYVRGRSHSRPLPEIIQEVRGLINNGYKEVVLTGINIGDFDGGITEGPPVRLADLIRAVDSIEGLERLRVSSIDPDEVDDDLADAILNGRTTCPSMHVVLQSGSNMILKRMNRKYTRQQFMMTVDRLRTANPDFTFTTDIIVGFPGETEADIEETIGVMHEVMFAKAHIFPYSVRPRTRAALYPNKVPVELIKERRQKIAHVAEQTAYLLREQYVGRNMRVLTEGTENAQEGYIGGHTDNFLPVWLPQEGLEKNMMIDVKLTENTPTGFLCKRSNAHSC